MTLVMTLTLVLSAVNGLLALALAGIYLRNHAKMRSPFTMGLLLFALALLVHNAVTLYTDLTMMASYTDQAETLRLAASGFETLALVALAWSTMR